MTARLLLAMWLSGLSAIVSEPAPAADLLDDLDVTMEVLDDVDDVDADIARMRTVEKPLPSESGPKEDPRVAKERAAARAFEDELDARAAEGRRDEFDDDAEFDRPPDILREGDFDVHEEIDDLPVDEGDDPTPD